MNKLFKEQLESIFHLHEDNTPGDNTISAKDMDDYVASGQASTTINSPFETVENSSHMRQIGENIYVRKENPFSLALDKDKKNGDEDDSYYWVLKRSVETDSSSGSATGA